MTKIRGVAKKMPNAVAPGRVELMLDAVRVGIGAGFLAAYHDEAQTTKQSDDQPRRHETSSRRVLCVAFAHILCLHDVIKANRRLARHGHADTFVCRAPIFVIR